MWRHSVVTSIVPFDASMQKSFGVNVVALVLTLVFGYYSPPAQIVSGMKMSAILNVLHIVLTIFDVLFLSSYFSWQFYVPISLPRTPDSFRCCCNIKHHYFDKAGGLLSTHRLMFFALILLKPFDTEMQMSNRGHCGLFREKKRC